MKITFPLFSPLSAKDLVNQINWTEHAATGYVIRDPNFADELLYLTKAQYIKYEQIAMSNSITLTVLAVPSDTPAKALARASGSSYGQSSTPPLIMENLNSRKFRLLNVLSGWRLSDSMVSIKRNFNQLIPSFYRNIVSWFGSAPTSGHMTDAWAFSKFYTQLYNTRGINYVIARMKVELYILNSYVAGSPLKDTAAQGIRIKLTRYGLPAHWPVNWRVRVRQNDIFFIRILATLLQSYKAIAGKYGKPDLSTIEAAPYPGFTSSEVFDKLPFFVSFMGYENCKLEKVEEPSSDLALKATVPFLKIVTTAGPNNKISILGAMQDAYAWWWKRFDRVPNSFARVGDDVNFFTYLELFNPFILKGITSAIKWSKEHIPASRPTLESDPRAPIISSQSLKDSRPKNILGKLSLKYEAAGKIRVFAIGDYWSQMALKPLHDKIFDILRNNPCDATFDQEAAVARFSQSMNRKVYSFDLKSATDLIPIQLYQVVLEPILGKVGALAWSTLMQDRTYYLGDKPYRYTRGQPMGMLSSWASLALVHHYLVFLSASRAYGPYVLFQDYLVLGDDIVIGDEKVASHYQDVCLEYGITIGLPKSYQSTRGFFQFASRNLLFDVDLSPVSLKEAFAAHSLDKRTEFVSRMVRRGLINSTPLSLLRASMGYAAWNRVREDIRVGKISKSVSTHLLSLVGSIFLKTEDQQTLDQLYFKTLMAIMDRDFASIVRRDVLLNRYSDRQVHSWQIIFFHSMFKHIERMIESRYARVHEPGTFSQLREDIPEVFMIKILGKYTMVQDLFKLRTASDELAILYREIAFYTSSSDILYHEYGIERCMPVSYWLRIVALLGDVSSLMGIVSHKDIFSAKLRDPVTSYSNKATMESRYMFRALNMVEISSKFRGEKDPDVSKGFC